MIKAGVKFRGYDYKKTKDHINKIVKTRKKSNLIGEKSATYLKLTNEIKMQISKLRVEEYYSIWKIANELGLGYGKVYSTLKELGLSTKKIK